jgi:hypothetical protein
MALPYIYGSTPYGGTTFSGLPEILIELNPAQATAQATQIPLIEEDLIQPTSAQATASVPAQQVDIFGQTIVSVTPVQATATATQIQAISTDDISTAPAQATASVPNQQVSPFGQVTISTTPAESTASVPGQQAKPFGQATITTAPAQATGFVPAQQATPFGDATVSTEPAQAIAQATQIKAVALEIVQTAPAEATAQATLVRASLEISVTLAPAEATAQAQTTTIIYAEPPRPILNIDAIRSNEIDLIVENPIKGYELRLYESVINSGTFGLYSLQDTYPELTDEITVPADTTTNRKFKATFVHPFDTNVVSASSDIRISIKYSI